VARGGLLIIEMEMNSSPSNAWLFLPIVVNPQEIGILRAACKESTDDREVLLKTLVRDYQRNYGQKF
jgi:hypothetical protein